MEFKKINKLENFKSFSCKLPSSKSITQRVFLCASLSKDESRILNPLQSEDTQLLKEALKLVGNEIEEKGEEVIIKGRGIPFLCGKSAYLGNNGTGSRFFLAYASLGEGDFVEIIGKPRLYERPVSPLVSALRSLGAQIDCLDKEGHFPVRVKAGRVRGGELGIPGNISSQFISALLLIAPLLSGGLRLKVEGELISSSYVNMTIKIMKIFGACVKEDKNGFVVEEGSYSGAEYEVEADASSASYFLAIPLVLGEGEVLIENYDSKTPQGDVKFLDYIREMGAEVEVFEPIGVKVKFQGRPKAVEIDLGDTPDLFPTMCILGAVAEGTTVLKGAPHLRYKETDRIKAMVKELNKLGVVARELPDGAEIEGTTKFLPAKISTYDDHRIAMSFAILGLKTGGLEIENPECVAKSFPEFWSYFEALYGGKNSINRI